MNTDINKQLIELKEEIFKLESDLKTLDYEEHRALLDYNESIRGRGVTEGGARPHIDGIHRTYESKKKEILQKLNKANYQHNLLNLKLNPEEAQKKNSLKSIHLVTDSVVVKDTIFLVLDERFEMPIRFSAKNRNGEETSIKKLHDITYPADAPGKKVVYEENIANNINNGLFKKRQIAKYILTNKLEKPTLVIKSETGTLVLKNDIPVYQILINKVPLQFQGLYKDKTK